MALSAPSTSSGMLDADRNILVEFCLLHQYPSYIQYFTENRFDSLENFLTKPLNIKQFYSAHPESMSTPFLGKLFEYHQEGDETFTAESVWHSQHNSPSPELPIFQEDSDFAPMPIDSPSLKPLTMFSINDNGTFPFIKKGQFSIANFIFPTMPAEFDRLNQEHVDDIDLGEMTRPLLSTIFREVCRNIWNVIKPAFPVNIPELVIHEICAVFSVKYPFAQANYNRILMLGVVELKEKYIDIGKYLKSKFQSAKKSKSETMKRNGSWVYQPGREGLAEIKKAKIETMKAKRQSSKRSTNELLREIAELTKLNQALQSSVQVPQSVNVEQSDEQACSTEDDESDIDGEEKWRYHLKTQVSTTQTRSRSKVSSNTISNANKFIEKRVTRQSGKKQATK